MNAPRLNSRKVQQRIHEFEQPQTVTVDEYKFVGESDGNGPFCPANVSTRGPNIRVSGARNS